ncbi:MAG: YggS family pyridoxal phosphate-dependent enzyme [Saprospiraceae bacterium]
MYETLFDEISSFHAKLGAVSKTRPPEDILALYHKGQRLFAENKVQELLPKAEALPKDIEWHFIGHLQKNKVRQIAPFIAAIESVDSLDLLAEIHKQAAKYGRVIPCLLEFHIAREESKFGLDLETAEGLLGSETFASLTHVRISGVMGMATFTDDRELVRREFRQLKAIFDRLKSAFFAHDPGFCEISMGMSSDYRIALEEGSTLVRIGTLLFGAR